MTVQISVRADTRALRQQIAALTPDARARLKKLLDAGCSPILLRAVKSDGGRITVAVTLDLVAINRPAAQI